MSLLLRAAAVTLALGSSALAAAACSDTGPSQLLAGAPERRSPGSGTTTDTSPTDPATDDGNGEGAASADASGGTSPGGLDAGADAADAGADASTAFTGAGAYVATTGPSTIQAPHPNGGNPAKADCLTAGCHGAGGAGPRFVAGGTVYTSAAGTTPAAQVEVRLLDGDGTALSAYTDVNGNFFVRAADAANLAFPLAAGARNAAATRPMTAKLADGACNTAACHGGAATGVIHVP